MADRANVQIRRQETRRSSLACPFCQIKSFALMNSLRYKQLHFLAAYSTVVLLEYPIPSWAIPLELGEESREQHKRNCRAQPGVVTIQAQGQTA